MFECEGTWVQNVVCGLDVETKLGEGVMIYFNYSVVVCVWVLSSYSKKLTFRWPKYIQIVVIKNEKGFKAGFNKE